MNMQVAIYDLRAKAVFLQAEVAVLKEELKELRARVFLHVGEGSGMHVPLGIGKPVKKPVKKSEKKEK